jgi:hypothetical protein
MDIQQVLNADRCKITAALTVVVRQIEFGDRAVSDTIRSQIFPNSIMRKLYCVLIIMAGPDHD